MQRITLLILLASLLTSLKAQTKLDTLYVIWQDEAETDSIRANAYSTYINEAYLSKKPDSAFLLAEELITFSKKRQYPKAMADAYELQAWSFKERNKYTNALDLLQRSLKIRKEIGAKKEIAECYKRLGIVHHKHSNFDKSIFHFLEALKIKEQLGDELEIAHVLQWIGQIYLIYPDREIGLLNAMSFFKRALKIYEKFNAEKWEMQSKISIGAVYTKQGIDQHDQGKLIKAIEIYKEALIVAKKLEIPSSEAILLGNIGSSLRSLDRNKESLTYLFSALEIKMNYENFTSSAHSCNDISETYMAMNDLDKAKKYALKAIELAKGHSINQERFAFYLLSEIHQKKGEYRSAIMNINKYHQLGDSIFSLEKMKSINENQIIYETEKKNLMIKAQESDIALLNEKNKLQSLQRNGLMIGFGVMLLFAAVFFLQRIRIGKEKERSEGLLMNILPKEVADELKKKGHSDAQFIDQVTVLFTDFKGFTALSEKLSPKELVADLHAYFSEFDRICEKYKIEKIKTIGDAYMAAGGLPSPNNTHARDVVNASLEIAEVVELAKAKKTAENQPFFEIRVGVHTGPVVAGIVGIKKFQYDIWGDTVNIASRMESSGDIGQVNISEATYALLKDDTCFTFKNRGKIAAKGKGELEMYFVKLKSKD